MAWTRDITPGKGYTWGGTDRKGDYYSEINPQRRAQYEADVPGKTWPWQTPRGRGDIDPKYWVNPGPSYDDRSGYATNIDREIDRATGKFNAVGPGITGLPEYVMQTGAAEDEIDKKRREFDHSMWAHMRLPSFDILGKVGDLAQGALRGSRLHSSYKDAAVAAGGTKAQGSKAWEADKRAMMTDEDQAFHDKYIRLAGLTSDPDKAREYRETAETAWRNKQTSDRLAAATGFEDYMPEKYTSYDYPGRGRMDEVAGNLGFNVWNPSPGSPRSTAEGRDAIASQMNVPQDDITSAISYGDPDPEGDILWGEPTGTDERVARGLSYAEPDMFDILYGEPTLDPFGGMYESPLTDRLYGEPTNIGLASELALGNRGYDTLDEDEVEYLENKRRKIPFLDN